MRRPLPIILLLLSVLPAQVSAEIERLLERADESSLHHSSQWLALLHFRQSALVGEVESQADDAAFFLSPTGKQDAAAELKASLRAMLQPAGDGHAQCLFPARWLWLKQQLGIGDQHDVSCPRFERWLASMSKDGLTLVFPAMYLNNPASSFGHTFLRFDNASSTLLSHALNYAALYDPEDDLISYSLKGIFGGYDGVFNIRRYFATVQEYNSIENRDIWEYELDYTSVEIDLLLRHVWEVLQVDFSYYFFTENCSYRLLALLDVMRDGSTLAVRDNFPLYAIPVDTVRVVEAAGHVVEREFRPALFTEIDAALTAMDELGQQRVLDLTQGADTVTGSARQLDVAVDMLEFRGESTSPRSRELLLARSRLGSSEPAVVLVPEPPESGHASARLELAAGSIDSTGVAHLGIRPAFHDLLDDEAGFIEGAAIDMMSLRLALIEGQGVELDELVLVSMQSLPAWRDWYRPFSWLIDIGFERHEAAAYATGDAITPLQLIVGGGASLRLLDGWRAHALLLSDNLVHSELEDNATARLGLRLGSSIDLQGAGRLLLTLESLRDIAGQASERDRLSLAYQVSLSEGLALRASVRRDEYASGEVDRWSLSLFRYF